MRGRMSRKEAEALFIVAGIKVHRSKGLINGYGYDPDDERFLDEPSLCPRAAWWFIKTDYGWIEIGWRKRVINIDWTDTKVREVITKDEVTKDQTMVHAWTEEKAIEYLKALKYSAENGHVANEFKG